MRARAIVLALSISAGCSTGDQGAGPGIVDAGAPPDLAPACLADEPPFALPDGGACPIRRPATSDALDELLTRAGLDRCTLGYTEADWRGWGTGTRRRDRFRLPFFDAVHDWAVNAPAFARATVDHLDLAAASPAPVAAMLLVAANRLQPGPAPCAAPAPVDEARPLAAALARVIAGAGGVPDERAIAADAADLPLDLQRALAPVVLAAAAANDDWNRLARTLSSDDLATLAQTGGLILAGDPQPDLADANVIALLADRFDQRALVDGAVRLALAIEQARLPRFAGARGFRFDQRTPLGRVVVHDAADDTYEDFAPADAILLLVDTGGDDTYRAPVGAVGGDNTDRRVAVAIDLDGSDTYGYPESPSPLDGARLPADDDGRIRPGLQGGDGPISGSDQPRQGAARLGYGFLFDYGGGADHYRSLRMSQGFGIAGVGVLYDQAGDDTYEGEAAVQGGATFGVGLLLDGGGADHYRTYTESQGFGYVRGVGILYDAAGDDDYFADVGDPATGGDPLYFTPQLPGTGNASFVQGAGFGRRAPGDLGPGDRAYMSGGLGLLRDRSGDDRYTASVFGQGTGYWFGTGILADGDGNDRYDGKWYVQGSAAHAALSVFLDDAGDDRYNQIVQPAATSIGVGHDFSVSWHVDGGGRDVYRAPGLSLGAGHANGVGVFINLDGDDEYHAAGEPTLGAATIGDAAGFGPRIPVPTVGLFLDLGGHDTYDASGSAVPRADGADWSNARSPADGNAYRDHGAGSDHPTGALSLP